MKIERVYRAYKSKMYTHRYIHIYTQRGTYNDYTRRQGGKVAKDL